MLLFELGTKALPSWDSKTRWNNLLGDLAVNVTAGSGLVSTIGLKRSTPNLQLSTRTPADYPIFWHKAALANAAGVSAAGGS